MSRKLFIAGNWKLNKTAAEAAATVKGLATELAGITNVDIAVCPTFTSLAAAVEAAKGSNVQIGAQNMSFAANGAYTGEVNAEMLQEVGVTNVIIGHSERRQYFGETDETVNQRTLAVLAAGFTPLTCIGETLEERESGKMEAVLETQIKGAFAGFTAEQVVKTVVAYEPVWAIGTGVTASPEQAQDTHKFVRSVIAGLFGQETADQVIIQYGGSVKAGNVQELMSCADIDGALVGGASLKVEDFAALVKNASAIA